MYRFFQLQFVPKSWNGRGRDQWCESFQGSGEVLPLIRIIKNVSRNKQLPSANDDISHRAFASPPTWQTMCLRFVLQIAFCSFIRPISHQRQLLSLLHSDAVLRSRQACKRQLVYQCPRQQKNSNTAAYQLNASGKSYNLLIPQFKHEGFSNSHWIPRS